MNFYEMSFGQRLKLLGKLVGSLPKHPLLLGTLVAIWSTVVVLALVLDEPVATIAVFTAMPISVLLMQRAIVRLF